MARAAGEEQTQTSPDLAAKDHEARLARQGRAWRMTSRGTTTAFAWRGAALVAYSRARTAAGTEDGAQWGLRSEIAQAGGWGGISRVGELHDALEAGAAEYGFETMGTLTNAHFLDPRTGEEFGSLIIRAGGVATLSIEGSSESLPVQDAAILAERLREAAAARKEREAETDDQERRRAQARNEDKAADARRRDAEASSQRRAEGGDALDRALERFVCFEVAARRGESGESDATAALLRSAPGLAAALAANDITPPLRTRSAIYYWAARASRGANSIAVPSVEQNLTRS